MGKKYEYSNNIICGDALKTLRRVPSSSVALAVTSPPYWNLVDYEVKGQIGQGGYEKYIQDLLAVWTETERVLIPNGKIAIITPIIPIEKKKMNSQHTRHLKNIANDIEHSILYSMKNDKRLLNLERYSLFIWQKQTTTKMFGSYPYPPNIYEDNTIEFINVYVKPGKPVKLDKKTKDASKLSQDEWLNLTMQVWPIMPEDIKRVGGHPAPFPEEIPARLISMYTFKAVPELQYDGDLVLDMFAGSGTTCVAAKQMGRRFLGIELNPQYCEISKHRIDPVNHKKPNLLIERIKMKKTENSDGKQPGLFS